MVQINNSFQQLFDKIVCTPTTDKWEIVETSSSANVKHLVIHQSDSYFFTYTDRLFKGMSTLTKDRSSSLVDSDCDAFAYVYKKDSLYEQLLFADLKSRFDIRKIKDAYLQMIYSFFKLLAMQSLCNGYSIANQDIEMIVACKCFENQNQEDSVYDRILQGIAINDEFYKLLYTLIQKQHATIKLNKFPKFQTIPFNDQIIDKEIKLTLVLTKQFIDETVEYFK